jgi:hypothetical protein
MQEQSEEALLALSKAFPDDPLVDYLRIRTSESWLPSNKDSRLISGPAEIGELRFPTADESPSIAKADLGPFGQMWKDHEADLLVKKWSEVRPLRGDDDAWLRCPLPFASAWPSSKLDGRICFECLSPTYTAFHCGRCYGKLSVVSHGFWD